MILVSKKYKVRVDIRWRSSNSNGVVDDDIFWLIRWLLLQKLWR